MKLPSLLLVLTMFCASCAVAQEPVVTRSYVFNLDSSIAVQQSKQDATCISIIVETLAADFRGFKGIDLQSAKISDIQAGALATYSDASFKSDYGNIEGTISCVFSADKTSVTDISVDFEGFGLGGSERRGRISQSDNPADWKMRGFSREIRE